MQDDSSKAFSHGQWVNGFMLLCPNVLPELSTLKLVLGQTESLLHASCGMRAIVSQSLVYIKLQDRGGVFPALTRLSFCLWTCGPLIGGKTMKHGATKNATQ